VRQRQGRSADESLPKLTLGQRVLAALPNLQRPPAGAGRTRSTAGSSDGAVRPDEVIAPSESSDGGGRQAAGGPVSGGRSKPNPYAEWSVVDLRAAMKRLDDRERMLPLVVGPLLAVLDLVLTAVAVHDNPGLHQKGHTDPATIVAVGVGSAVVAGLVLVAALLRRRSFTIFALLFSGYGGGLITMLPAWAVAGWLFVRFNRMQKVVVAKTGGPGAARGAAAKARADRTAQRRTGRRGAKPVPPPAGPEPSKRYTPPKPVRTQTRP
jgi:hypothetical protein